MQMNMSLHRALAFLEAGDWQAAHAIVQRIDGPLAAWAHGIVHILEGDYANARYWYGRAARTYPGPDSVRAEIAALKAALASAPDAG